MMRSRSYGCVPGNCAVMLASYKAIAASTLPSFSSAIPFRFRSAHLENALELGAHDCAGSVFGNLVAVIGSVPLAGSGHRTTNATLRSVPHNALLDGDYSWTREPAEAIYDGTQRIGGRLKLFEREFGTLTQKRGVLRHPSDEAFTYNAAIVDMGVALLKCTTKGEQFPCRESFENIYPSKFLKCTACLKKVLEVSSTEFFKGASRTESLKCGNEVRVRVP